MSVNSELRDLFNDGYLYTVKELSEIIGVDITRIRTHVSILKNRRYCGKKSESLELVQDYSPTEHLKRWGVKGATEYYSDKNN